MRHRVPLSILGIFVALLALILTTGQVSAHGGRHVAGKYHFVVGFLEEPAYAQMKNGLDLTLCTGEECEYIVKDGLRVVANPVEQAEQTLKAEVTMGSAPPLALTLEPRFNNSGKYAAYFVPTKEGAYTFRIFGTLGGAKIDEKFTSGTDDFSEVAAPLLYPASTEANGTSSTENAQVTALQNRVVTAENTAKSALTFGIIGSVLGIAGIALAIFAFTRKPKTSAAQSALAENLRG